MVEVKKSHLLETSLGQLTVEAVIDGKGISGNNLAVSCDEIKPSLPHGMSVERCRAVFICVKSSISDFNIRIKVLLETEVEGGACTGQGLEAREWENRQGLLVVGTEDAEEISRRMPWHDIGIYDVIASYEENAMEINFSGKSHAKPTTLHMIIAENSSPEVASDSAWFAVDLPHSVILEAF